MLQGHQHPHCSKLANKFYSLESWPTHLQAMSSRCLVRHQDDVQYYSISTSCLVARRLASACPTSQHDLPTTWCKQISHNGVLVQMCVKPEKEAIVSTNSYKKTRQTSHSCQLHIITKTCHNEQSECHSRRDLLFFQMWRNSCSTPEPEAVLNMLHMPVTQEIAFHTKCPKRRWKQIPRQHDLIHVQIYP